MPNRRSVAALILLAAAGVVAAGCGGSSSSSSSNGSGAAASTGTPLAQVRSALAADYRGTDRALPGGGPKAVKGKTVWVISCTQAGAGCAIPAAGAMEAGRKIGWNMKLVDGKYDPSVFNQQVRAAIAAKANGIILVVIDCALVQGPLKAAKAAGIKIYGLYSLDCNDRYTKGTPLFDGQLSYGGHRSYGDYIQNDYAKAMADYVVANTHAKAKIVELKSLDTAVVHHINDGFEAEVHKTCPACRIYTKVFTGQDFVGGKLQAFTSAMLTQHPDANVVMAPYDAAILLGVGPAVQQAEAQGRHLVLTGGEGLPPNVKLIKSGLETFAVGAPGRWAGWASVDGLNRVFAGRPQVDAGIGHSMITAARNLPTSAHGYDGNPKSTGYDTNYERIWGVG